MQEGTFVPESTYGQLKPTVDSCFSNGWNRTWKNFLELFLVTIILFVASVPMAVTLIVNESEIQYQMFSYFFFVFFYGLLVLSPLKYGMEFVYLQAARGEKVDVSGLGSAFRNYLNVIFASILVEFLIFAGTIFFIIPGIIVACKLAFVPYLVTDRRLDAIEAIQVSWSMTSGRAFDIFLIYFLSIPISIAGFLCLLVGIIPAGMWIGVSKASMYHAVCLSAAKNEGSREDEV